MIKLLKTDLYKLIRTKSLYVTCFILIALELLYSFVNLSSINSSVEDFEKTSKSSFYISDVTNDVHVLSFYWDSSATILFTLLGVIVLLFMCSDFSFGTIKNVASKGFSRMQILISKYICFLIATVAYTIIAIFFFVLPHYIFINKNVLKYFPNYYKIPSNFPMMLTFLFFMLFAYLLFPMFLSLAFRKNGPALSVFLITNLLLPFITGILDLLLFSKAPANSLKIDNFIIPHFIGKLALTTVTPTPNVMTAAIVSIAAYFVIFGGLSALIFKKRDI